MRNRLRKQLDTVLEVRVNWGTIGLAKTHGLQVALIVKTRPQNHTVHVQIGAVFNSLGRHPAWDELCGKPAGSAIKRCAHH